MPPEYQVTSTGERFLIDDSGIGDEKRTLSFGALDALQLPPKFPHWFADRTFKVCPRIFSQVYTLHSFVQDRFLPGINAFLPDKSEDTYCRLFEEVSNILDLENPLKGVITGFEIAAVYAAAATFEGTEIKGYFFHLCLNLWKRI